MDLALIADLERDPRRLPVYHGELEAAVSWLMDRTFEGTDPLRKPGWQPCSYGPVAS